MPTEEQIAAVRRLSEEIWGQGNLDAVDELFSHDFVRHGPDLEQGPIKGQEGMRQIVIFHRTAFPDLEVPIKAQFGDHDTVMTHWTARGTNKGPMLGAEPTGRSMELFGFWLHRFSGGKIVEEWTTCDTLGLMQQIGASV